MSLEGIDAVVLCGGLGKRLRSEIGESQKVMAEVKGEPFLNIILEHLKKQGVERIILCTGYKADNVEDYYRKNNFGLTIEFSKEDKPLGTGGAVKHAQGLIKSNPFFVLNGDSFCEVDFPALVKFYQKKKAGAALVVSQVQDSKDFGGITLDGSNRITAFQEKQGVDAYVNAGVYCFNPNIFALMPETDQFSLEYDVFPKILDKNVFGFLIEKPFTDIGTPERYKTANEPRRFG